MRVALIAGAYQSRSLIANAQRSINLYAESNPQDSQAPVPTTHYLTPGLTLLAKAPNAEAVREVYRATNGDLYVTVGQKVYFVDSTFNFHILGTIPDLSTPTSMSDNGNVIVLVDGTTTGYAIDMKSRAFGTITDPSFLGSNFVDYIDTFFVFNQPGTFNLYITLSEVNYALLTGTGVGTGTITNQGSGYTVGTSGGTYSSVPLTGGTGTGATAEITIGVGCIATGSASSGGSGYLDGTYQGVALTGGTGAGATATFTVSGGVVTSVTNLFGGSGYLVSDALSVSPISLGNEGSGFVYTVSTIQTGVTGVTIDTPGQGYVVGNVLSVAAASVGGTGTGFTWQVGTVALAFDPLDIAAKSGSADPIQRVTVVHREVWPIGALTSEIWIDSGAADFALQPLPGAFIEHGCVAPFSVANWDNSPFWLSQDREGKAMVVKGMNYTVQRISTHAIEAVFQSYANITDAIGFVFQQEGHVFYIITFPSADATWGVDIQTGQWFEWASMDTNGALHRVRANCCCFAYGMNIVGDYQNGNLYQLDPNNYTDNGSPILRLRSFPHLLNDGKRVTYTQFIADLQVGTQTPADSSNPPLVSLRWSDDRGYSYGNPIQQSMGAGGQSLTSVSWWRLGLARDRVFELSWSAPVNTSINGAFIEMKPHKF